MRALHPHTWIAAVALTLFAACTMPPWEERHWADDDASGCIDGAQTSGTGGTTWITVCGDSFSMGSPVLPNETPLHTVDVPDFEMLESEVTVTQYDRCRNTGPCTDPEFGGDCNWAMSGHQADPINCVTWLQAVSFCFWAGGHLPSESEWEFAARNGGQNTTYPWGEDEPTCGVSVMDEPAEAPGCDTGRTMPACSKEPGNTDQGLCDMTGNVFEWVQDWYHEDYETPCCAPEDGSPWEDPETAERVLRGGSYDGDADSLRASARAFGDPEGFDPAVGFRCAR